MDRYCPECNSTMTPSLVGYLCVNCGHAQRFYSSQEATLTPPKSVISPTRSSDSLVSKTSHRASKPNGRAKNQPKNKVKSTLKRLMVPELTPPHSHLIGSGGDDIKPVLADKIIDEQPSPASAIPQDTTATSQPNQEQFTSSPAENPGTILQNETIPNQSSNLSELESALHPQKNTSIWVMLGLAVLMLIVAAAVLFLIILS